MDRFEDFECLCNTGYTGKTCIEEINECDSNPCKNQGSCNDLLGDYKCECLNDFTGKNCADSK